MMLDSAAPSTMVKTARALASTAAAMPGSPLAVRAYALAPPAFKNAVLSRVTSAIASRCLNETELVETNLGLRADYRVLVPARKHHLTLGKPDQFVPERATLELARRLAPLSDAFIDVGANEGIFTFAVAADQGHRYHERMHLFEPDPRLFSRLKSNLIRNQILAHANKSAMADTVGTRTFYRNVSDDLSGSLTRHFETLHHTVPVQTEVTSLSHYLQQHDLRNVCVKIDVEGAGVSVWSGASRVIDRIGWFIIEIIGPELEADLPRRIIRESGWNAWYIRDFELVRSVQGEFNYAAPFYNWLFTPKCSSELKTFLSGTRFQLVNAI